MHYSSTFQNKVYILCLKFKQRWPLYRHLCSIFKLQVTLHTYIDIGLHQNYISCENIPDSLNRNLLVWIGVVRFFNTDLISACLYLPPKITDCSYKEEVSHGWIRQYHMFKGLACYQCPPTSTRKWRKRVST